MINLFKIITLSIISISFFSYKAFAVTAEDSGACSTGATYVSGSNTACRFTPQLYQGKCF